LSILDLIREDLRALEEQSYAVTVVAHSFGAYLIHRLLRNDRFINIKTLILCGAVIQRRARWIEFKLFHRQIEGEIINLCGKKDPFPPLAELACMRFGATGTVGAGDPSVQDRYFPIEHGGFFSDEFFDKYFSKAIFDGKLSENLPDATFSGIVRVLLYLCSHKTEMRIGLGASAVLLVALLWFRPEFSCNILSRYMNVYREDDLRGSYLENGASVFSRAVRTSYALNFLTDKYVARRHVEPNVAEPNVYELDERHAKRKVEGFQVTLGGKLFNMYDISVYNYSADSVLEFNGGDRPEASAYIGRYPTKNIEVEIKLPQGVKLIPCEGDNFSSGIVPKKYTDSCQISQSGSTTYRKLIWVRLSSPQVRL
jgi:hypothetical protein